MFINVYINVYMLLRGGRIENNAKRIMNNEEINVKLYKMMVYKNKK